MIESIRDLEIKGRKFIQPTPLRLFSSEKNRVTLLFGRNGSGKSTIADGFRKATAEAGEPADLTTRITTFTGQTIELTGPESTAPGRVHVFDEKFTDKFCRFVQDGLKTIVLMGETGDLYNDYTNTKRDIEVKTAEQKRLQAQFDQSLDRWRRTPSEKQLKELETKLKSEDSWLGREALIKGAGARLTLDQATKTAIFSHKTTRSESDVRQEFGDKIRQLQLACESASEDFSAWPRLLPPKGLLERIDSFLTLMSKKVERPTVTASTERILSILRDRHQDWLQDAKSTFSTDIDYCPFCARDITEKETSALIADIDSVINREATEYAHSLKNISLDDLPKPPEEYQRLSLKLWTEILNLTGRINDDLAVCREAREMRLQNVYEQVTVPHVEISARHVLLNDALAKLQAKLDQAIADSKRLQTLKQELSALNIELTHFQIRDSYKAYEQQRNHDNELKNKINDLATEIEGLKANLQDQIARMAKVEIAEEEINKNLARVFLSTKRISIHHDNGLYGLKVNGKDVKLKNISTGERNIISLCYFFVHIMKDESVSSFRSAEHLVVLDDPISSFDTDVRMGVLALIYDRVRALLNGNPSTRSLIMTHDHHAFYELWIAFKLRHAGCLSTIELRGDLTIGDANLKEFNEYILLLKQIFKFAKDGPSQCGSLKFVLGNIMRRVLEAYSTFHYCAGFEILFESHKAQERLGEYYEYFSANMTRFVANDESHSFSHIRELVGGVALIDTLSSHDRQAAARDVICLLHLYDPQHIKSYLEKEHPDLDNTIANWLAEIKSDKK